MTRSPSAGMRPRLAGLDIGRVALTVHDLDGVTAFYRDIVGLAPMGREVDVAQLGAGDRVLLELRRDANARRPSPREAGLFHTAFLLPSRADLGAWLVHAAGRGVALAGASDHGVSEALYLSDPEGNGIEIYADRPAAEWKWHDGTVEMPTHRLDLQGLAAVAASAWRGAPAGSRIGHVHLQVGAVEDAESFYAGLIGLGITARANGGTWYAAGGYHHQLATNVWNSRGAPVRTYPAAGLADVELLIDAEDLASLRDRLPAGTGMEDETGDRRIAVRDPWGTQLTLAAR